MKKHSYNKDFFKIWTDDMAYILGFWFADGHITMNHKKNTSKVFAITQSIKDRYLLEKMAEKMSSSDIIKDSLKTKYKCSVLKIYSKEIYDDLVSLGGSEKKSCVVAVPTIPDQFFKKFLLGFFDGDGSVVVKKNNTLRVTFTGGFDFLSEVKNKIQNYFVNQNNFSDGKIYLVKTKNNKTYNLEYSTFPSYLILNWLYEYISSEDLFLKRKYEKFKNYKFSKKSKYSAKYIATIESGDVILITNLTKFLTENDIPEYEFRKSLKKQIKYKGFLFSKY